MSSKQFRAAHVNKKTTGATGIMSVAEFNESGFGKEDKLQESCLNWFRLKHPKVMIRGSMNGVKLAGGGRAWKKMVSQGVLDGEADLHIMAPSGEYHSLFVELKTRRGKQRASQERFEQDAISKGHGYAIARSLDQFRRVVNQYLEHGTY